MNGSTMSAVRRDRAVWIGLLALLLGICLADRGFAYWRNNVANFMDPSGHPYVPKPGTPVTWHDSFKVALTVEITGWVLLLSSVYLLRGIHSNSGTDRRQAER